MLSGDPQIDPQTDGLVTREPVLVRSASDIATELIRTAIMDGRLEPGQRLKEKQLAHDLGISRTPVREALLILQTEGLVVSTPNRGAAVRSYDEAELLDMYDLRATLEGFAARRAAARITPARLDALAASCDRFAALRVDHDLLGLAKENLVFHYTIVEVAGPRKLADFVRSTIELPLVQRAFFGFSERETEQSEGLHRRILAALAAGDAERSELLMKEHIFEGRDFLVATSRDTSTPAPRAPRRSRTPRRSERGA